MRERFTWTLSAAPDERAAGKLVRAVRKLDGVAEALAQHLGDRAAAFSRAWRDTQLEYSFRRGLMRRYRNFAVCTRDALEYTNASLKTALSERQKQQLLEFAGLPSIEITDGGSSNAMKVRMFGGILDD